MIATPPFRQPARAGFAMCTLVLARVACMAICMAVANSAHAATLSLLIEEAGRGPLADAIAFLVPESGTVPAGVRSSALMDQVNLEFAPHVLAVRRNVAIRFPNRDDVRHHVYSFSPAKRFELRLYSGTPSEPVIFEEAGPIVLGCNIHDWMLGYIYVVDTPWFAQSPPSGKLQIDAPAGRYTLNVWHPRLADINTPRTQTLELPDTGSELRIALPLKAEVPRKRGDARTPEDRFRSFRSAPRR